MVAVYPIVRYQGTSPYGRRDELDLEQLTAFVTRPWTIDAKLDGPGWSPARYAEHYAYLRWDRRRDDYVSIEVHAPAVHRRNEGVLGVGCLVLDIDHQPPDWARLSELGALCIGYTTFSHQFDDPRWRLVLPLASEVPVLEWPAFWYSAVCWLGLPGVDAACKDASHLYYLHAAPHNVDPFLPATHVLGTQPLDPRVVPRQQILPDDTGPPLLPAPTRPPTDRDRWRADRFFHATITHLASHGEGGRQASAYGTARGLGHFVAAGALEYEVAWRGCWIASVTNGVATLDDVRAAEVKRAIRTGLARGIHDGAVDLDAPRTDAATTTGDRGRQRAAVEADYVAMKQRETHA